MGFFTKKERQAIRIDKEYDSVNRIPEYIVGPPDKIAKTISDAKNNPVDFAQMMASEDGLPTPPNFNISLGNFGYADADMEIPIVARFSYIFDTDKSRLLRSRSRGFITFNKIGYLIAILILVVVAGSAVISSGVQQNAQALSEIATQCIVFTENGKVKYVSMFGERHYFNVDGTPPLLAREVTPHEQMRLNKPFEHCEWNSNDGVLPYQLYP
jgi:hypothetical protein